MGFACALPNGHLYSIKLSNSRYLTTDILAESFLHIKVFVEGHKVLDMYVVRKNGKRIRQRTLAKLLATFHILQ